MDVRPSDLQFWGLVLLKNAKSSKHSQNMEARATERFANVAASIGEVRNCRQKQGGGARGKGAVHARASK